MDSLEIELRISDDNAEVVLAKNKQRFADFVRDIEKKQPQLKFTVSTNQGFIDLDKLEKKADETRKKFAEIASTRLSAGNINNLTRELVTAHERSRQLVNDITAIKAELASPNRKSSIAFLTQELRAAEKEADSLNRKLSALPSGSGISSGGKDSGGGKYGKLRGYGALFREFAPAGINETEINAGLNIAEKAGVGLPSLALFGSLAIAGAAVVKITGDIREQAELRLRTEEKIASAMNKQILAAKELTDAFESQRKGADFDRNLKFYQQTIPIEVVRGRRDTLEKLIELNKDNPLDSEKEKIAAYRKEFLALDDQVKNYERQKPLDDTAKANSAMDQRWENYKKSVENSQKAEENSLERRMKEIEKFNRSVEEGKNKVGELVNKWNTAFESVFSRQQTENPFVRLFTEADKARKTFEENSKGLSKGLISQFEAMEAKINARQLLETRLDNSLSAFDLRGDAKNFRNPYDADKDKQTQERFIQDYLRRNPNYLYLKQQEYNGIERVSGYKNPLSFEDFYRKDILKQGNSFFDTPESRLNKSLEERFRLIYDGKQSPDQLAAADRRFISITGGVNPLSLNDNLREKAALAREHEADRRDAYEKESLKLEREKIQILKDVKANQDALLKVAEKEGIKGVKSLIEIIDKTNGAVKVLGASPKPEDMAGYDLGFAGGTNY